MENDPLGSFMCQNRNNNYSVHVSFVRFQRLIHKLQTFVIWGSSPGIYHWSCNENVSAECSASFPFSKRTIVIESLGDFLFTYYNFNKICCCCCLCGLLILLAVAFSPTFSFSLSTQEFQDVANSDSRQKVPLFHSSTISNDLKAASPTSSLEVHDKLDRGKIRSATRCLRFLSMAKPKKCFKNLMRVSISLKRQLKNIRFSCSLKLGRKGSVWYLFQKQFRVFVNKAM